LDFTKVHIDVAMSGKTVGAARNLQLVLAERHKGSECRRPTEKNSRKEKYLKGTVPELEHKPRATGRKKS